MSKLGQDFFEVLMQTQHMPAERWPGYQRELLERLLRHARTQVPFYRDSGRLDPLFKPDGAIAWERWPEIPPLTRREAQQNAQALYADVVPPECGTVITGYTAGSTGMPLAFRLNTLMATVGSAMIERGFAWAGLPADLSVAWFRNDRDGSAAYPHGEMYRDTIRGGRREMHYLAVQTPVEQQGHWLARVQPDVVVSYPGILALLAQSLPPALLEHTFRLAVCIGEVTTAQHRAAIEEGFGCPVLDLYSGAEFGPVAIEDPRIRRMFVCEETTLVEFLPRGAEFAEGDDAMAEVILTPFYNYAMPLIRYAPGDFALVDQAPQPDARTLRRVRTLVGRVRNFFILPSGRRWWPTYQNKLIRDFLDYRQIQFAQTAHDRIEIRYASDLHEPVKNEEKLHAYLRSATPEPMMIAVKRVAEVPRRASGKYEDATCELDTAARAASIDAASGIPAAPSINAGADRLFFAPMPSAPYRRAETIDRFLSAWRRTQHLPPDRLWDHQRDRLELLLRHARAHVPFYRDTGRLDPIFRRNGTIDWARWSEIPLLTRREVQEAGQALHSERLLAEHGRTFEASTSGSTGEPVTVVHCALSGEAAWTAILLRDFERHDIDTSRRYARIGTFPREESSPGLRRADAWHEQLAMIGRFGERLDIPETMTPKEIIDALESFRPAYVRFNPVALELLCAWDQERRLAGCGIEAIFPNSDHLSEQMKRTVFDHIGCRILDRYASNECGFIAATCPYCERFHVHSEVVRLEVLDEQGVAVAPGQTGWVVVTPLYNFAMPLIRYDHADQARVGQPGKCRITLPTLDAVDGKVPTVFAFPGGRQVRPVVPFGSVIKLLGAQAFQVAQVAEDRCEFRIVPGRLSPADMRFDDMTKQLRERWWDGLQVDYRVVERLKAGSSRSKVKIYVREYPHHPTNTRG